LSGILITTVFFKTKPSSDVVNWSSLWRTLTIQVGYEKFCDFGQTHRRNISKTAQDIHAEASFIHRNR